MRRLCKFETVDKLRGGVAAMGRVFELAVVTIVVVELG